MLLVSPHQSLMFAPVSGTVDAGYTNTWLTNGRGAEYPVQRTGAVSLTVTPAAAQDCDVFAVCQHRIDAAATIALTGSLTNTIPTATYPPDGIPHNWFRKLSSPVSVSSLVLGITGHTNPAVIGELYAGLAWEPAVDLRTGRELEPGEVKERLGEFGLAFPYDEGISAPRGMTGELALETADFAQLKAIHAAQRNGSRPCLFIPDPSENDAWLCVFSFVAQLVAGIHYVSLEVLEIPRVRW